MHCCAAIFGCLSACCWLLIRTDRQKSFLISSMVLFSRSSWSQLMVDSNSVFTLLEKTTRAACVTFSLPAGGLIGHDRCGWFFNLLHSMKWKAINLCLQHHWGSVLRSKSCAMKKEIHHCFWLHGSCSASPNCLSKFDGSHSFCMCLSSAGCCSVFLLLDCCSFHPLCLH